MFVLTQVKHRRSIDNQLPSNNSQTSKDCSNLQSLLKSKELKILDKLGSSKFAVYVVRSKSMDKTIVMKVFPFTDDQPSHYFKNEINAARLSHPNVVSILSQSEQEMVKIRGYSTKLSYVLMEHAPYGDMLGLIKNSSVKWDEKMVRSYFHQLIEGIEYLHSQGVAHLDLKPENMLIGEDFKIKVADFDLSQNIRDKEVTITSLGTMNYRAPETITKTCEDPQVADIYSAGIILFVMKSGGIFPFLEKETYQGEDLYSLLNTNPWLFWKKHSQLQEKGNSFYDENFQSLIVSMTKRNPKERATLAEIKNSKWYQGSVYSNTELVSLMTRPLKSYF